MINKMNIDEITLHCGLRLSSQAFTRRMKHFLEKRDILLVSYASINPPFVLTGIEGNKQLISHHFIYVLLKKAGHKTINVRTVETHEEAAEIMAVDKSTYQLLNHALDKPLCDATRAHQRRRDAGQICPLCCGPLTKQPTRKGEIKDGKELFSIRCHYRHYPQINCKFSISLEKAEYELFTRNQYPTAKWLNKIEGKRCPKCKKELFERKSMDGTIYHQCHETLLKQNNYFGEDHCDFKIEIE